MTLTDFATSTHRPVTHCWKLHISSDRNRASANRCLRSPRLSWQSGERTTHGLQQDFATGRFHRQRKLSHRVALSYRAKPYSTLPCRDQFDTAAEANFPVFCSQIRWKSEGFMEHCTLPNRQNRDCVRPQTACCMHTVLDGYSRHFHCFLKHLHGAAVQTSSSLTSLDLCQDAIAPIATAISVRTGMEESCVLKEAYPNASPANGCYGQNNWKTADFSLSRLN